MDIVYLSRMHGQPQNEPRIPWTSFLPYGDSAMVTRWTFPVLEFWRDYHHILPEWNSHWVYVFYRIHRSNGRTNYKTNVLLVGVSTASLTCQSGTSFTIGGIPVSSAALTCSQRITGEIQITSTSCGGGAGQLRNIGFLNPSSQLVTYIQSCYNVNTASVIYTRHIIPGRAINRKFGYLVVWSVVFNKFDCF